MAKKTENPKIEFPHPNYPIKVLGETADDYQDFVIGIVKEHASDLDVKRISLNESRNGRFTSITLYITARSEDQLHAIHKDLIQYKRIRMVM